ncbi:T9SS type A sorting domain-containing protein [bacterium]|nr:T9SS type A sorting domain-containing protein [bacterium]
MKLAIVCTAILLMAVLPVQELLAQSPSREDQVWFTPNIASVDMLDLFTSPEQWATARSQIDVFKFYTVQVGTGGWGCVGHPAYNCGDNHIENFVGVHAFWMLGLWDIDIAVESFFAGPVVSYEPVECSTDEYVYNLTLDGSINVIQSIEANGGTVRYLAMDEPLRRWIPEYYYTYWGEIDPRPCLADSIGVIADHMAAYISQMEEWFPSVEIGHIELYPEVGVEQLKEWIIALEARGVTLPFLHLDVNGPRVDQYVSLGMGIDVAADLAELESFFEAHGIEFGIIFFDTYWGSQAWDPDVYNDQFYFDRTMDWVSFVNDADLEYDHSIFQSWVFPVYTTGYGPNEIPINLPEDDPSVYSHTRLINDALSIAVGVATEPSSDLPAGGVLHQNRPNPFNPTAVITYEVPRLSDVSLKVYDARGREIQVIVSGFQEKGIYSVVFEGRDLPSGVYFYELQIGENLEETKKMLLVK